MNKSDLSRDYFMLKGPLGRQGYDWWWHSFTGISEKTGEEKSFFIEFFTCNPQLAEKEPVLGQLPENRMAGKKPSYVMVKAGWWGKDATQLHRFFPGKRESLKIVRHLPFRSTTAGCQSIIPEVVCR